MFRKLFRWLRGLFTREGLPKLALILFSLSFTLVALEFAYRLLIFGPDAFSIEKMNSFHRMGYSQLVQPSDCPEMIYELVPDTHDLFKLVPFDINSRGQRDAEYPLEKPAGTFRIIVIGDSLVMGTGIALEDTFQARLEVALNETGDANYEVINFGVAGYYLRQYAGLLTCRAQAYDPDLVIVGFYPGNDSEVPPEEFFDEPYEVKGRDYPFFFPFALRELASTAKLKAEARLLEAIHRTLDQPTSEESAYMTGMFNAFGAYATESGVPILVAYLAYRSDYGVTPDELEPLTQVADLCFIDLSAAFAGADPTAYRLYAIDDHPNPAANEIFASELLAHLRQTGLLTGGTCP